MRNIFLSLVRTIHTCLSWLGLRSPRHWGVVYDSITKQPVDPVVVKLIDAKLGKVVASSVANLSGEYGFMVGPGVYKIFAHRANFSFPSKVIRGPNDGIYTNVYTGQIIEFSGDSDVLSLNIPLDPTGSDWNQQDKQRVVKVSPWLERISQVAARVTFWLLFLLSGYEYFFIIKHPIWITTFCILGGVLLLSWITPEVRLWGRVMSKADGQPLVGITVKVTHLLLPDIVIAHAVTTDEGKFFVRLAKGKYQVMVVRQSGGDEAVLLKKTVSVGSEGLLNDEFYV